MSPNTTLSMFRSAVLGLVGACMLWFERSEGVADGRRARDADGLRATAVAIFKLGTVDSNVKASIISL